ncbi:hypothetical protein QR90_06675 [Deinococcus radiopugnans]|uniref:DUF7669 domain-containing protein n=1 Tax=Deinococcus radiopugnans TaxID=57497 RepID=A0A0A7KI27_9DEIO|nr:hypothetical protein [Deinococcus radiopugnans]AIZ44854.1 hypothetical protein QR90_06675 [Deinococcus radiopugnans]
MTCRDEILAVARKLSQERPDGIFTIQEIVAAMRERGTQHLDATIRRHVATEMCSNAVGREAGKYQDLERVERGQFRLL